MAAPIMLLVALSLGCVAHSGQVGVTAGYGVGYFGPPLGFHYGVWGPRYRVAPYRAPFHSHPVLYRRRPPHVFRAAPIGRPVPSIPQRRRPRPRRAAYRFDDRTCALELVVAPNIVDAPAGSRTRVLVALDESREPKHQALQLRQ